MLLLGLAQIDLGMDLNEGRVQGPSKRISILDANKGDFLGQINFKWHGHYWAPKNYSEPMHLSRFTSHYTVLIPLSSCRFMT